MSFNRDRNQDRAATRTVLLGQRLPRDGTVVRGREVNWLGHEVDKGAAQMDDLLLEGGTRGQLEETRGAVDNHLSHLRTEHGLTTEEVGGLIRFERASLLNVSTAPTATN